MRQAVIATWDDGAVLDTFVVHASRALDADDLEHGIAAALHEPPSTAAIPDAAVTFPDTRETRSKLTVAESPGGMVSTSRVESPTTLAPLTFGPNRLTLTKFAGDVDVFVTVTSSAYCSPAITVSGWVKVSVNVGFLTRTAPTAPRSSMRSTS